VKALDNLWIIQSIRLSPNAEFLETIKQEHSKEGSCFTFTVTRGRKFNCIARFFPRQYHVSPKGRTENKLCFAVWRKRTTCLSIERVATRFVLARRENTNLQTVECEINLNKNIDFSLLIVLYYFTYNT